MISSFGFSASFWNPIGPQYTEVPRDFVRSCWLLNMKSTKINTGYCCAFFITNLASLCQARKFIILSCFMNSVEWVVRNHWLGGLRTTCCRYTILVRWCLPFAEMLYFHVCIIVNTALKVLQWKMLVRDYSDDEICATYIWSTFMDRCFPIFSVWLNFF